MVRHRTAKLLGCLFLFMVGIYLLTGGGHYYSGDGHSIYQTTRAIVDRGALSVDPDNCVYGAYGREGRFYSKFGVGQAIAAIPFYLGAKATVGLLEELGVESLAGKEASDLCIPVTYTFNQFVTAAAVVAFCSILLALGMAWRAALFSSLALGLSTMLWPYSKYFLAEPLLCLCLLLGFRALIDHRISGKTGSALLAGFMVGFACLVKISAIATVPAYLIYVVMSRPAGTRTRSILSFGAPVAAGLTVFLLLNYARFGSPFTTGYIKEGGLFTSQVVEGTFGLLFSPGKSVFLFSPLLIASIFFIRRSFARFPREALFCLLVFLSFILLHGPYHSWMGGFSWGPRYLAAVVPFAFLPAACAFEACCEKRNGGKSMERRVLLFLLLVLIVLGILVQVLGVLGNYHDYDEIYRKEVFPEFSGNTRLLQSWSFTRSHLFSSAYLIGTGRIDLWFLTFLEEGIPAMILFTFVVFLAGVVVISGFFLMRPLPLVPEK